MAKTSKTTVTINEQSGRALTELARHAAAIKAQLSEKIGDAAAESAIKYALARKDQYMAETIRVADGMQIMRVTARPEVNEQFRKDCEKYGAMTSEEALNLC